MFNIIEVDESGVCRGLKSKFNNVFINCKSREEMEWRKELYLNDGYIDIEYDEFEVVGFGRDDVRMLMNFDDIIVYILKDWIDVRDFMDKNGIVVVN